MEKKGLWNGTKAVAEMTHAICRMFGIQVKPWKQLEKEAKQKQEKK